jgi:hypothetical protein
MDILKNYFTNPDKVALVTHLKCPALPQDPSNYECMNFTDIYWDTADGFFADNDYYIIQRVNNSDNNFKFMLKYAVEYANEYKVYYWQLSLEDITFLEELPNQPILSIVEIPFKRYYSYSVDGIEKYYDILKSGRCVYNIKLTNPSNDNIITFNQIRENYSYLEPSESKLFITLSEYSSNC